MPRSAARSIPTPSMSGLMSATVMLAPDGSMRKAMSPVPPAMSRIASPARGFTRRTKRSFHSRCIPPDIASFMMSYLRATRLNTSPTIAVLAVAGTSS